MEKYFYAQIDEGKISVAGNLRARLGTKIAGEGIFAEWDWDGRTFTLKNDRYGFYPIYVALENDKFAVSPSIARLLELGFRRTLDREALAVFLRFSSFVGEDTAFEAIRAVPPGAVLTWENGDLQIRSGGVPVQTEEKIERREALINYGELFQKAIEKTLPTGKKIAVPLSGGRDSRHILFSLCQTGNIPDACLTAIHQPPRANEDAKIARLICAKLGIVHHAIEQKDSRVLTERYKNIKTGFGAFEHGWFRSFAEYAQNRWSVIYDGIGGDMLTEDHFFNPAEFYLYKDGKFPELAERFLQAEGYLPKLLAKGVYQEMSRERAVGRLVGELEKHAAAPNPFSSFYFWNRTRRCVTLSFFRLFGDDFDIITPYLDRDLFDFLSSLPGELFFGNTFHTETIAQFFPAYRNIPYENLAASLNLDASNFRGYSREILRYAISPRETPLTRRSFFPARCLRGLVDKNYGRSITDFGDLSIFLLQLERLNREIPTRLSSLRPDRYPKRARRDIVRRRDFRESQWQLP